LKLTQKKNPGKKNKSQKIISSFSFKRVTTTTIQQQQHHKEYLSFSSLSDPNNNKNPSK